MIRYLILLIALPISAFAHFHKGEHTHQGGQISWLNQEPVPAHEMQHGFILTKDDRFGSHLVATGHHSRQAEITGELIIEHTAAKEFYDKRKALNSGNQVYFLFQAQKLDLPTLKDGQILIGHIVESQVGKYEPKNIIVNEAKFKIEKVLLNIENPFFGQE